MPLGASTQSLKKIMRSRTPDRRGSGVDNLPALEVIIEAVAVASVEKEELLFLLVYCNFPLRCWFPPTLPLYFPRRTL